MEPNAQMEGAQGSAPKAADHSNGNKHGKATLSFANVSPKVLGLLYQHPPINPGENFLPAVLGAVITNPGHTPLPSPGPLLRQLGPILAGILGLPFIPKILAPPPVMAGPPYTPPELFPTAEEEREINHQRDLHAMDQARERQKEQEQQRAIAKSNTNQGFSCSIASSCE